MFAHLRRVSVSSRRRTSHHFSRVLIPASLCFALLAGCTGAPPAPLAGAHPANPDVGAKPVSYRSVIGGYTSQRPREPGGWQDNNTRVAPQEKP